MMSIRETLRRLAEAVIQELGGHYCLKCKKPTAGKWVDEKLCCDKCGAELNYSKKEEALVQEMSFVQAGSRVWHPVYGRGTVLYMIGTDEGCRVKLDKGGTQDVYFLDLGRHGVAAHRKSDVQDPDLIGLGFSSRGWRRLADRHQPPHVLAGTRKNAAPTIAGGPKGQPPMSRRDFVRHFRSGDIHSMRDIRHFERERGKPVGETQVRAKLSCQACGKETSGIWQGYLKTKCPDCGSTDVYKISNREYDKWARGKQEQEPDADVPTRATRLTKVGKHSKFQSRKSDLLRAALENPSNIPPFM